MHFYWANEGISGPFIVEDAHSILRQKLLIWVCLSKMLIFWRSTTPEDAHQTRVKNVWYAKVPSWDPSSSAI